MNKKKYFVIIALIIFIIDRLSKIYIESVIDYSEKFTIINQILSITKIYNKGAAFSILENNIVFLIIFSLSVSLIILYFLLKNANTMRILPLIAWNLILGGTLGNLYDRLFYNYVIDFIQLDSINFPVFNIADASINIGAIIIIILNFPLRSKDKEKVDEPKSFQS